jgi:uncharacterized membrane protein
MISAASISNAPAGLSTFNGEIAETGDALSVCPNRSLSFAGLRRVLAVFAAVCVLIALASALQGNYFAPVFAIVNVVVVSAALLVAWHVGDAKDSVMLADNQILIDISRGARVNRFVFHPLWTAIQMDRQRDEPHVWLSSRGQAVEIGSFLNAEQRQALFPHVQALWSLARERSVSRIES